MHEEVRVRLVEPRTNAQSRVVVGRKDRLWRHLMSRLCLIDHAIAISRDFGASNDLRRLGRCMPWEARTLSIAALSNNLETSTRVPGIATTRRTLDLLAQALQKRASPSPGGHNEVHSVVGCWLAGGPAMAESDDQQGVASSAEFLVVRQLELAQRAQAATRFSQCRTGQDRTG